MSREQVIVCDACFAKATASEVAKYHWDQKPSCFEAHCPEDGVNGGVWKMDVCARCRRVLHDAIHKTIYELRRGTHASQQSGEPTDATR